MTSESPPINIHHRRTTTASSSSASSSNNSSPRLNSFASALIDATPLSSPTAAPTSFSSLPSSSSNAGLDRPLPIRQLSGVKPVPLTPEGHPLPGPPAPLNLSKLANGVVPSRNGSVLSRGLLLKSDYRYIAPPSASQTEASAFADPEHEQRTHAKADAASAGYGGFHLSGATNFRDGGLGIWGCAQPSETGVLSVLTVLRSRHDPVKKEKGRETVWFCTREEPILYLGQ